MNTALRWHNVRKAGNYSFVTTFSAAILAIFLMPFLYMIFMSLKTPEQISQAQSPIWPAKRPQFVNTGQNTGSFTFRVEQSGKMNDVTIDMSQLEGQTLEVYTVPLPDGTSQNLALVRGFAKQSVFLDPAHPETDPILWDGSYRSLERPWTLSPTWTNYATVWDELDYPRLLWNTFFYAFSTTIGMLVSCVLVAFGFSRFRFPGRDLLFVLLISTIFLPGAVTIIPTFTFFTKIGWVGTWLPLIVPSFFSNAYDTFLLRQYFMTLPRELDEAAMIDGAGPLRVLWSVIIPQSYAAIVAVSIFHIVWAWNDYFGPLIYLTTKMESQPISVALARFNGMWGQKPQLIQAGALMTLIIPLIIFFAAQRFFIQGIVITGVEK
jgi:multiple sugar transport system permease protein